MPRPKKCRIVGFIPNNPCFHPQVQSAEEVVLSIEEIEAVRLSDLLMMEQDKAADNMEVSRGTFQRIINSARLKLADAIVNGKIIRIEGGNFEVIDGKPCCRRHRGCCRQGVCDKFEECKANSKYNEVEK
ncbi:MAG: DUF134 domain-containing protein [Bacillota bacterium]|nr:DUF134 domain-containing protein [Bacillota bacterium]